MRSESTVNIDFLKFSEEIIRNLKIFDYICKSV